MPRRIGDDCPDLASLFLALAGVSLAIGAVGITTRHWTPLLDPQLIILAPLVGILVGAIYPSWRASHIQPTEALRR